LLGSHEARRVLAERLASVEWIDQEETPHDEPPSWTLATGLADIEASCRELLDRHLPELVCASSHSELSSALRGLRVDLEHVVYHVATTPALRSLIDNAPPFHEA
jgi:hypothetical protein